MKERLAGVFRNRGPRSRGEPRAGRQARASSFKYLADAHALEQQSISDWARAPSIVGEPRPPPTWGGYSRNRAETREQDAWRRAAQRRAPEPTLSRTRHGVGGLNWAGRLRRATPGHREARRVRLTRSSTMGSGLPVLQARWHARSGRPHAIQVAEQIAAQRSAWRPANDSKRSCPTHRMPPTRGRPSAVGR